MRDDPRCTESNEASSQSFLYGKKSFIYMFSLNAKTEIKELENLKLLGEPFLPHFLGNILEQI